MISIIKYENTKSIKFKAAILEPETTIFRIASVLFFRYSEKDPPNRGKKVRAFDKKERLL